MLKNVPYAKNRSKIKKNTKKRVKSESHLTIRTRTQLSFEVTDLRFEW